MCNDDKNTKLGDRILQTKAQKKNAQKTRRRANKKAEGLEKHGSDCEFRNGVTEVGALSALTNGPYLNKTVGTVKLLTKWYDGGCTGGCCDGHAEKNDVVAGQETSDMIVASSHGQQEASVQFSHGQQEASVQLSHGQQEASATDSYVDVVHDRDGVPKVNDFHGHNEVP